MSTKKTTAEIKLSEELKKLTKETRELARDTKDLSTEVRRLKKLEFIRVFKHPLKFMGFSLLKGLLVGFGSVLGATVLVAVFIYILAQISFVPIIGDFVEEVVSQIELGENSNDTGESKSLNEQFQEVKGELNEN